MGSTFSGRPDFAAMSLWSLLNTPVWGPGSVLLILVLLLRLSVQVWHKLYLWDLQCCSTDLTGKIAVVTGANSGECSSCPVTSLRASASNSPNREGREEDQHPPSEHLSPPAPTPHHVAL